MKLISIDVPQDKDGALVERFFENLKQSLKDQGGFDRTQVEFFSTENLSIPLNDEGDRALAGHEHITALVYEVGAIQGVVNALRAALTATWPAHHSLQIFEISMGKKRSLWSVRGGKP